MIDVVRPDRPCGYCGETMTNPAPSRQFCSHKCRGRQRRFNETGVRITDTVEKKCPVCETSFVSPTKARRVYCSPRHASIAEMMRASGKPADAYLTPEASRIGSRTVHFDDVFLLVQYGTPLNSIAGRLGTTRHFLVKAVDEADEEIAGLYGLSPADLGVLRRLVQRMRHEDREMADANHSAAFHSKRLITV